MTLPKNTLMLGGLIGIWVTVAVAQLSNLPELREVPLTYTSGQRAMKTANQNGTDQELALRPMRIAAAQLPSSPTRNIFDSAAPITAEKRIAKVAERKHEVPPSTPVVVVAMPVAPPAPPMPSPEELAERTARAEAERTRQHLREVMAQYRYLGYLTGHGEQKAFLSKGQDIYIIHLGETLDGQFQVASITPTTVKILAAQSNVETTIWLKAESSGEPS